MRISDWSSDVCSSDLPVVQDQREGAHIQHLADEPGENVRAFVQRPPETGERNVDGDQDGRQEGDVARQQTESRVDVGDEGLREEIGRASCRDRVCTYV